MAGIYNSDITQLADYPSFKEYLRVMMGHGLINVEVQDEHVQAAFHKARSLFIRRGNNELKHRFLSLPVKTDQTEYDLPDDMVDTIVNVIQTQGGFLGSGDDPFNMAVVSDLFLNLHGYGYADMFLYQLSLQQIEQIRRMTASEIPYKHDKLNNTIRFFDQPKEEATWFLECYMNLTDEEYMQQDWIQSYTLAELKGILGRAYRKFSTISTPAGEVSLDGEQLIRESNEEKKELIEDIDNYVDSGMPTGSPIIMG